MPNLRSSSTQSSTKDVNSPLDNVNDTNLLDRIDDVVQKAVEKAMERERLRMKEEMDKREERLTELIEHKLGLLHDLEISIDSKMRQLEEVHRSVEKGEEKVSALSRNLHNLQQYSRRNNVRIFGVPEKAEENLTHKHVTA